MSTTITHLETFASRTAEGTERLPDSVTVPVINALSSGMGAAVLVIRVTNYARLSQVAGYAHFDRTIGRQLQTAFGGDHHAVAIGEGVFVLPMLGFDDVESLSERIARGLVRAESSSGGLSLVTFVGGALCEPAVGPQTAFELALHAAWEVPCVAPGFRLADIELRRYA